MKRVVLVGLAVAMATAGCGSSNDAGSSSSGASTASGGSTKPIVIGLEAPFTGDYGIFGQAYLRGIKTWTELHGPPKIGNRPVQIKQIEDGCDVATSVAAFRKNSAGLTALIGPACSSAVKAVTPLIEAAKIPAVFLGQSASLTAGYKNGWLLRATQPDTANQQAFAKFIVDKWKAAGIKKIAILHDTSVLDAETPKQWAPLTKPAGIDIVNTGSFDLGETNFTSQVLKVKNSGAQAVIVQTYGPEVAGVFKAMGRLGVKIPAVAGTDTAYQSTLDGAGSAINGTYFYSDYVHGSGNPALKQFEEAFKKLYPDKEPDNTDFEAWLAFTAIMEALKQPGAADNGKTLADALHGVSFPLGDQTVAFLPNGDQKTTLTFIGQVKNGKTSVVEVLAQPRDSFTGYQG